MREAHFPRNRRTPCPTEAIAGSSESSLHGLISQLHARQEDSLACLEQHDGKRNPSAARAPIRIRESPRFVQDDDMSKTSAAHRIRHPLRRFPRPKRPANILRGLLLLHGLKHRGFNLLRFPGQP